MRMFSRFDLHVFPAASSALFIYYGTGLRAHWPITWFAPLPVLLAANYFGPRATFWISFVASFVGGMNMVRYYRLLFHLPVALLLILAQALLFAFVIGWTRRAALRLGPLAGALTFPVVWTAAEFAIARLSGEGAFYSLAYTQTSAPLIIQIASVTGLWGISFLLCLAPAGVAMAVRRDAPSSRLSAFSGARSSRPGASSGQTFGTRLFCLGLAFISLLVCLGYAHLRLQHPPQSTVRVGLAATDSTIPYFATEDRDAALRVLQQYAQRIESAAGAGAQIVLLPEKFVGVAPAYVQDAQQILGAAAAQSRVWVVAGINEVGRSPKGNVAWVFSPDGHLQSAYEKRHFVPRWEEGYAPGHSDLTLPIAGQPCGVAICKDMDYPWMIRGYGRAGVKLMLVPAWDFVLDGRLHFRMALMRGVENGFAVARVAQQGLLTASDAYGRILAQQRSDTATDVVFAADVPFGPGTTPYARTGDWFAWLSLLAAVFLRIKLAFARVAP